MADNPKSAFQQLQEQLEIVLNEQRAEIAVHATVMQCFLLRIARTGGPEGLIDLRNEVVATLGNMQPSEDPQGDMKVILLRQSMALDFFDRIAIAAGFETSGSKEDAN